MNPARHVMAAIAPATVPVSFLSVESFLNDPAKMVGVVVLVLQAIYTCIRIYKEYRPNEPKTPARRKRTPRSKPVDDAGGIQQ